MDEQRKEDLNPRSEDIEAKVKRMLDPNVPDTPEPASPTAETPPEQPQIRTISVPITDGSETVPTAPEIPATKPKATKKSTKKTDKPSKEIVIPISHESDDTKVSEIGRETEALASTAPEVPKGIKKITIKDHSETPEQVAEKLDEAIAELEPANKAEKSAEEKTPSKPEPTSPIPSERIPQLVKESLAARGQAAETPTEALPEPTVVNEEATEEAVDDIVAEEGDTLLETDELPPPEPEPEPASAAVEPKKHKKNLLTRKGFWKTSIALIILLLIAAGLFPQTRYLMLNTAGVRATSSVRVLDVSTQQPLKNVQVQLGNATATTDDNGKATLSKIKLGTSLLTINKRAFSPITKTIVVGWGSNPLGDFQLSPTGTQYTFNITDFFSGKPVSKVQVSSGEAIANSDDKGVAKLTVNDPGDNKMDIQISADGYRTEQFTIDPNQKIDHNVKLVAARKQLYVTKRSGKYDIYSVYADGKDDTLILAGTGSERSDMVLTQHPSANYAAYISTRSNQHNSAGTLLSSLIVINLDDNSTIPVVAGERLQLVNWSGDYLVYVQIDSSASPTNPKRYHLMSYNFRTNTNKELATSSFFNDVALAKDVIYYAPSSAANQSGNSSLFAINPDGTNQTTIFDHEVWNLFRTSYDHLTLGVQQEWYDLKLGDKSPIKLNVAPTNQTTRVYLDSPDGKRSLWVDTSKNSGVLTLYDIGQGKDTALQTKDGLKYPVGWLNNTTVVYRVSNTQETADYAMSTDGGQPVKIEDVVNAGGIDRWYTY